MDLMSGLNLNNLRIARENMGFDTASVSKQVTASIKDIVADWEGGKCTPSWSQIEKLSKIYQLPELLFFSNKNLEETKKIPDFRIGVEENGVGNRDVKKLINLIFKRQCWLEKKFKATGRPKNLILGLGRNIKDSSELARFIKEKLSINSDYIRDGLYSSKDVLEYLIERAEEKGIFIGKTIAHHRISVSDMRGLFIANDYAPYIVINRRDAVSAQIFTFVHELAHLFRSSEGLTNNLDFRSVNQKINKEEVFCNRVASELLLPAGDFRKEVYTKTDIENISNLYKLSRLFVFYRLKDLEKIDGGIVDGLEKEIISETEQNILLKKKIGGGDYNNNMKDSNGDLFNKIVSNSYFGDEIGYVEASKLLNFSVEKI